MEFATLRRALRPDAYFRTEGPVVLAIALLGILLNANRQDAVLGGLLVFDWTHNTGHVMLGLLGVLFGYANLSRRVVRVAAFVLGATYLALGVAGIFDDQAFIITGMDMHLEPLENVVHILAGGLGLLGAFLHPASAARSRTAA